MERFIHRENLSLYRKKLAEIKDEATLDVVRKLLAEEEAKEFAGTDDAGPVRE